MSATAFAPSGASSSSSASSAAVVRHRTPYDSVLDTIGWTPLIRLRRLGRATRTPLYGKAEFFNPGGSVKDRIGLPIVEAAERSGALRPGGTIVEGRAATPAWGSPSPRPCGATSASSPCPTR
jgi:cystathionine beta-synthase